jgi:hypothetical protein
LVRKTAQLQKPCWQELAGYWVKAHSTGVGWAIYGEPLSSRRHEFPQAVEILDNRTIAAIGLEFRELRK